MHKKGPAGRLLAHTFPHSVSDQAIPKHPVVTFHLTVAVVLLLMLGLVILRHFTTIPIEDFILDILFVLVPTLLIIAASLRMLRRNQLALQAQKTELTGLQKQFEFQSLLLDNVNEALIATDLDGKIIFWSKGAEKLYGLRSEDSLGRTIPSLKIDSQAGDYARLFQVIREGAEQINGEYWVLLPNQSHLWVDVGLTLSHAEMGQDVAIVGIHRDVTDRKQTEQALEESEERYRSLFHESRAVMLLIDPETGSLIDANQSAVDFYGYPRETLLRMKITALNCLASQEVFGEMDQASQKTRSHFFFKHRLASGAERDVEVYSGPVHVYQKTLLYSIVHDITERRQAELALQDSERRLSELMESVHLLAMTVDNQGQVLFCNQYLVEVTGWTRQEIIGSSYFDRFVPKEELPDRLNLFNVLLGSDLKTYYMENDIVTKAGRHLRISWNLIGVWEGDKLSRINCIGEDVTEHRKAERDLESRMGELAALQQAGRFITTSLDLKEILGGIVSGSRLLLGSESATMVLHHPDTQELEYVAMDGVFQGTAHIDLPQVGQRVPDIAGVIGWVIHQAQPVMASHANAGTQAEEDALVAMPRSLIAVPMMFQGRPIGVLEVSSSAPGAFTSHNMITLSMLADFATMGVIYHRLLAAEREQRQLVEQSQEQLIRSEKLNAMGRLVAFLAHEINNPIQSLRSGLNLMLECQISPEKHREYLQLSSREVDRLSGIVERVLGFYRRSSDMLAQVDLQLLLDETLKLLEKRMESTQIEVIRDFSADLPPVYGFFDQLHQVFLNIILNATNAMPQGGRLTLQTRRDPATDTVRITIRDTGVGISPEVLPHIFEPFFTTRSEGSGLGLPICYSIVEKHQGRIEVESTLQVGTAFTVILPLKPQIKEEHVVI